MVVCLPQKDRERTEVLSTSVVNDAPLSPSLSLSLSLSLALALSLSLNTFQFTQYGEGGPEVNDFRSSSIVPVTMNEKQMAADKHFGQQYQVGKLDLCSLTFYLLLSHAINRHILTNTKPCINRKILALIITGIAAFH